MTSQVAIFNQRGVAVASDTVMTITSDGGTKTINNTEKLWALGDAHLVVVALSGNSNINSVHAGVLMTEWSKSLDRPLPTVEDYAANFCSWLADERVILPPASDSMVARQCLGNHFFYVRDRLISEARRSDLDDSAIAATLLRFSLDGLDYLKQLPSYDGVSEGVDVNILENPEIEFEALVNEYFEDVPGLDQSREVLFESGFLVLAKAQRMPMDTTLGFIGYGSSEYFARSVRVDCRGRYGGQARTIVDRPFGVSHDNMGAAISTFAQTDAIHGFLRGAQYNVLDLVYDNVWDYLVEQDEDPDEGVARATNAVSVVKDRVNDSLHQRFIDPMLDLISSLSLRDVADLATALVGIQAMRANASPEPPGVGGLIESLVIDRADGVRWVQRLPK